MQRYTLFYIYAIIFRKNDVTSDYFPLWRVRTTISPVEPKRKGMRPPRPAVTKSDWLPSVYQSLYSLPMIDIGHHPKMENCILWVWPLRVSWARPSGMILRRQDEGSCSSMRMNVPSSTPFRVWGTSPFWGKCMPSPSFSIPAMTMLQTDGLTAISYFPCCVAEDVVAIVVVA